MSCLETNSTPSSMRNAIERASQMYIPLNVTIELSQGCNLKCAHCYNFDRRKSIRPSSGKPALTPPEMKKLLAEIRQAGAIVVAFSGGEALLHPHLLEYVREARRLRLAVRLKTNGTLLTEKKARELRDAGVTDLEVSLYGSTAATHDALTRVPGSFEKTVAGVRIAKQEQIAPTVNFVLHHGAADEVGGMLSLAAELGVPHGMSTELTKRYDGTGDSLDLRLTQDDLRRMYASLERNYFAGSFNDQPSVQCACARTNAGVGYDGTVYPCIGAPIESGDVREQSFDEIWRSSSVFKWIRELSLKDFKSCAPCDLRRYCQRSSGAIHTNTGEYTGPEKWTCEQAALLKELNESLELA